jgi:antitoxin ParD1/3/4
VIDRQIPTNLYNDSMAQLNISIPPQLKSWIDHRVAQGRYSSASDYMRDLVRRDQASEPDDAEWVKAMLAEGEASGLLDKDPRDVIEEIIADRHARHG